MRIRFMRLLVSFDLPTISKKDLKNYRDFVKFLKNDGYLRVQYSLYAKLCINKDVAKTAKKRMLANTPLKGDIRAMIISENQYLSIVNVLGTYSLQEKITTTDRTLMIGGMNDED